MVHYIDAEFNLHQRLMAFEQIYGEHTGENLARIIYDCLNRNNLCEKLHCVSGDNATNNNTMVESLFAILRTEANVIWDHKTHHVRCHLISSTLWSETFSKVCCPCPVTLCHRNSKISVPTVQIPVTRYEY